MNRLIDEVATLRRLPAPRECKAIRQRAGVSLARLGAELGVSAAAVSRWEAGTRVPSVPVRGAYCDLLDALKEAAA